MPKRISVDAALANSQPYIYFRGVDYPLRDGTVRERIERMLRFREEQEAAEAAEDAERQSAESEGREIDQQAVADRMQAIFAQAVQEALVGVPDEVASTVTEREFKLIQQAVSQAREMVLPEPPVEEVKDEDLKRTGEAVLG